MPRGPTKGGERSAGDNVILEGTEYHVVAAYRHEWEARHTVAECPGRLWRKRGRQYLVLRPVPPDTTGSNPYMDR